MIPPPLAPPRVFIFLFKILYVSPRISPAHILQTASLSSKEENVLQECGEGGQQGWDIRAVPEALYIHFA